MKPLDLKLNVNEIPEAGVDVVETLPPEWVAESLLPAYEPAGEGRVEAEVTRMGENALVRGRVLAKVAYQCSRTLERAEVVLDVPFAELFVRGHAQDINLADADVSSDDLEDEPWLIESGQIDIEALIREHLVLAQDPYPLHPSQQRDIGDDDDEPAATPMWSSKADNVDPRWEALKGLKLDN
jgi:uncharacterized metal-binding protein YceD (DUF177 family)